MQRLDPLDALREKAVLQQGKYQQTKSGEGEQKPDWDPDEQVKITIRLPLKLSNELKKMAIDHRISRDKLVYLLVRQLQTDPELLSKILRLSKTLCN